MILLNDYEAYCFDLDGTIYIGDQLLSGVKETIKQIRKHNKKILFITNSPTLTRKAGKEKLEKLGIETNIEEIITAPYLAATYFAQKESNVSVFVIGEEAIFEELEHFGINTTDRPLQATHVLVGLDQEFTYHDLNKATEAVRYSKKLIITNPDPACPVPGGFMPDTMSIAKAIEVASEQQIDQVLGKPDPIYGNKMLEILDVPPQKTLVIGDRLETDIHLGVTNGFKTCLVLTGISTEADVQRSSVKPDYIINDLLNIFYPEVAYIREK